MPDRSSSSRWMRRSGGASTLLTRNALEIVVSKKPLRDNLAHRLLVYIECGQAIADAAWLRTLEDQSFVGVDVSCDFGDVRFHKANVLL